MSFSNTATATNAALTSDLLRSPADAGRAFAFLVLGGNIFGLLAPIVTGYIVQATGSFSSAFVLAGVLALSVRALARTDQAHAERGALIRGSGCAGGEMTPPPTVLTEREAAQGFRPRGGHGDDYDEDDDDDC